MLSTALSSGTQFPITVKHIDRTKKIFPLGEYYTVLRHSNSAENHFMVCMGLFPLMIGKGGTLHEGGVD